MIRSYVIVGGGGHASVLTGILKEQGQNIVGVVSPQPIDGREVFRGLRWLKRDRDVNQFDPGLVLLINGLGPSAKGCLRENTQGIFEAMGYKFSSVISSSAYVSNYSHLAADIQLMPKAVVQTGVRLGKSSVVNSGAIIEHDCQIGSNVHVAPGAILCGGVVIESGVYIGANSTLLPGVKVGCNSIVGAGAVIAKNIPCKHIFFPPRGTRAALT